MDRIVLIGAGSAVFTRGLVADLMQTPEFDRGRLALVDTDPEALRTAERLVRRMLTQAGSKIKLETAVERRSVLPGAGAVVTTIGVGGRRAWERDVFIPRNYGIYQPVGDTTMPGGISRAFRMIPALVDIARDVADICPDAHFFNYANPMTANCRAIRRATGFPVVGLCHGVKGVEAYLSQFAGVERSRATFLYAGLNHLTFMYDFRIDGQNAWPWVRAKLAHQRGEAVHRDLFSDADYSPDSRESALEDGPPASEYPFSWEIFERFGAYPAVHDRHVTEFFPERFSTPESYYGKTLGVDAFSFEGTIASGDRRYKEMQEQAEGMRPFDEGLFRRKPGEHEQLVNILLSLASDDRTIYAVNVPNRGVVPQLPHNAILEVPAAATGKGFAPLAGHVLSEPAATLLNRRIAVIELTVSAALRQDADLFTEALLADGSVADADTARRLAGDLLDAHREHLPRGA